MFENDVLKIFWVGDSYECSYGFCLYVMRCFWYWGFNGYGMIVWGILV